MAKQGNNAKNVTAGKPKVTGALFWAPTGSNAPTDATTELDEAFKCLGYAAKDGLVNGIEKENEKIKAWGGDTVLSVGTSRDENFEYTLLEALNVEVLKHVYGPDNVDGTLESGLTIKHNGMELPRGIFVAEVVQTGGYIRRIVVKEAQVDKVDKVEYKDEEPVGYKTTLMAYPDEDGNTAVEYIAKPAN